jgi:hypothetical protein
MESLRRFSSTMNKYKQFVEETGQSLRFTSWLLRKATQKISPETTSKEPTKMCPRCGYVTVTENTSTEKKDG